MYITHLDGRVLHIQSQSSEIIKPGDIRVVEGEGMPINGNASRKGDLYIKLNVEFPTELTAEQQKV
jgi:DnaJ family protein A protein 2